MAEHRSVLTDDEWFESEFDAHYCAHKTYFHVDHNGRVFVWDEDAEDGAVLNEAADAPVVHRKIIALCNRFAGIVTRADVELLREFARGGNVSTDEEMARRALDLADRIEALLPPREPARG